MPLTRFHPRFEERAKRRPFVYAVANGQPETATTMGELAPWGTLLIGLALALGYWSGQDNLRAGLLAVESDIREKLRRVRLPSARLHTYIVCWAIAVAGLSAVVWIALGPVTALLASVALVCLPWLIISRIAARRLGSLNEWHFHS